MCVSTRCAALLSMAYGEAFFFVSVEHSSCLENHVELQDALQQSWSSDLCKELGDMQVS